jgi:acid phosphatase
MHHTRRDFLEGILASLALGVAAPASAAGSAPLSFLVVGDWGDAGSRETASAVATAMGKIGEKHAVSFVVSTGDNFYERGVSSVTDPLWQKAFEDIYTAPALQVPWYVVLGNHDYSGNTDAQLAYTRKNKRWTMPARYYKISKALPGSAADFFFLDTQHLKRDDWFGRLFSEKPDEQLTWLEAELAASTARWKIVVGHHPVFSGGEHGDNDEMIRKLKPLLDRYGVAMYLCGHDHDLEALQSEMVAYFVSGSGSRTRPMRWHEKSLFASPGPGFLLVELKAKGGTASFFDDKAALLYSRDLGI